MFDMQIRAKRLGAALAVAVTLTSQGKAEPAIVAAKNYGGASMIKIQVVVGDNVLTATLDDTTAARDFAALLPLDLTLTDYHGIEKIADLPRKLDTDDAPPSYTPAVGDITYYAPWGNVAIFYKPFRSAPGLVRLGAFDGSIEALIQDQDIQVRMTVTE